ncbi:deoxyribodipyrimidine photo-lyase [Pleionea sp. CnH1-48]|uniref:cryptochrome/photolyase family protein n=1 Tax=Pleionea sp. CnH1-48 TaxID=2954494 RepID=UPI002097CA44|nr:deoxyribodipyrimidine photo-lyase [Pleionea sp. CnH1-48]MCO7224907.1 DNA photolyase family protein [Pleionea sp. CnH1-48]
MSSSTIICWFRQDLRLSDNPALFNASREGKILPIFILDDDNAKQDKKGAASRIWLHHSLSALNESLNGHLKLYRGNALAVIRQLCEHHSIKTVYWNRCYEPWRTQRDAEIKKHLLNQGINAKSFNASLLWEPWENLKADGTPYKVFTPFYKRGCLQSIPPRAPLSAPQNITFSEGKFHTLTLPDLALLSTLNWPDTMMAHWKVGEQAAQKKLKSFIKHQLDNYQQGRDYPAKKSVSRLSPHIHWGEISPHQIWQQVNQLESSENTEHLKRELAWREFSYSLLFHNPELTSQPLQKKFSYFPWQKNNHFLTAWQKGATGYPIVDAGMRELWQTGYMHNRVRMIVGSFLVKNLLQHWGDGLAWFYDCLVDADLASNSASWQWIAGCGADAAPYFRIFNPITQGKKFDEQGDYTRQFVPELKHIPDKYLHAPWEAPEETLNNAGVILGKNYPLPIVDLKESRATALDAYQTLKSVTSFE